MVVHALTGMARVSKGALALVAAHRAMAEGWFAGGVFFGDLHGYTPAMGDEVPAPTPTASPRPEPEPNKPVDIGALRGVQR